jgi:DNA modification methylase
MSGRVEQIGDCTLVLGDCRDVLPTLGRVDAVVTSPPYAQQRKYGGYEADWRATVSALCNASSEAQVFVNLGLVHRNGEIVQYWTPFLADMQEGKWRLFGWYIWDKCDGMGGDWHGRLAPSHEFIFHFNKTPPRFVRKTYHSKLAGLVHRGNPGLRGANGVANGYAHQGKPVQDYKIPDSVLRIIPERNNYEATEHPAVYPVLLPRVLIDTYTESGELVVDPFMGSGTTGVACVKLGRKFIGIEIEERYFDIACRRIEAAYAQPDLFIEPAPKEVQPSLFEAAA